MTNGNLESRGTRNRWLILIVALTLLAAVGAYLQSRPRRIRITVTHPQHEEISSSVVTNGKAEPVQNFEAHTPIAILVKRVLVKQGQQVRKGELIVELDDGDARERLARSTAQLKAAENWRYNLLQGGSRQDLINRSTDLKKITQDRMAAERNLQALIRLQQQGAASPEEVAAARDRVARANADEASLKNEPSARYSQQDLARIEHDLANARAAVESAKQFLDNVELRAPFDGTVYYLPVKTGMFVSPGDILFQMADLTQMQIRAFVDEPEIGRVQMGQSVRITWDALPGRVWQAQVTSIPTTVINRGSRVVGEVLCSVQNQDKSLLPNVDVGATIITSSRPGVLTIPREALHNSQGQSFVYVLRDNELHKQVVRTGVTNLTRVEILSGLNGSETLGLASLSPSPMSDGISVKVVENNS